MHYFVGLLIVGMLAACPRAMAQQDPWRFVDTYAPIMKFNSVGVRHLPTGFGGESGTCAYVNIKPGYVFQYWVYYAKDIRIDAKTDRAIKQALQQVNRSQQAVNLDPIIRKAFHDHDWELVEVHVPRLGALPSLISFYAHGTHYDLVPNAWPIGATMQGKQCVVKVVTDMHGSYPAGMWTPANSGWRNIQANAEFAIIWAKELAAGYHPELGNPPSYRTVNFAGKCRRFSSRIVQIHRLRDYPYQMPWDRGFKY